MYYSGNTQWGRDMLRRKDWALNECHAYSPNRVFLTDELTRVDRQYKGLDIVRAKCCHLNVLIKHRYMVEYNSYWLG